MVPAKFFHDKSIANTEVYCLIAEGWNAMAQEGLLPFGVGAPPFNENSRVIYAVDSSEEPVGVLVYDVTASRANIHLLYVEPSSRRMGVGMQLVDQLKGAMKSSRLTTLTFQFAAENDVIAVMIGKLEAQPRLTIYEAELED